MGRSRTRQLAVVVVLCALALAAWWRCDEAVPPEPPIGGLAAIDATKSGRAVTEAVDSARRQDLADAVPAPIAPAPKPDLAHPFAFALELRLVDAFGLPVPRALVLAAPPLCGLSLWPESSGDDGRLQLHWRGRRDTMPLRFAVLANGVLQPMRVVDLVADRARALAIVVSGRPQDEAALKRLLDLDDEELAAIVQRQRWRRREQRPDDVVPCGRQLALFRALDCVACHSQSQVAPYATLARCGSIAKGLHDDAVFADLGLRPLDDAERARRQHRVLAGPRREPESTATAGAVAGTVQDSEGKAVVGVPVAALGEAGNLLAVAWTGEGGRYRLDDLPSRALALRAGGADAGDASALVVPVGGPGAIWDPQLIARSVVRGSAHDEQGGSLPGFRVEFESIGEPFADLGVVDADGRFALPGVPGAGICLLWSKDQEHGLPLGIGTAALPDTGPVSLRLDPALPSRSRLRIVPRLAGEESGSVVVHLTQVATGRVAPLRSRWRDGVYDLEHLCPGEYRLEVGAPLRGHVEVRDIHVDGRGEYDLGGIVLPPPGRLRLRLAAGEASPLAGRHEFCRRTPHVDIREQYEVEGDEIVLPAGEHVLVWQNERGRQAVAFALRPGLCTEVGIDTH